MRIGDLAKATGLAPSRIRFYEAEGLISAPPRGSNGYRNYPPEALGVLKIIDSAQRAGFTLGQIRHFLPSGTEKWDHAGVVQSLAGRVAEIQQLIRQLQENEARLLDIIDGIAKRPQGISCTDNMHRVMNLLDGRDASPAPAPPGRTQATRRAKRKA